MPIINGQPLVNQEVNYQTSQGAITIPPKPPVIVPIPEPTTIAYDGQTLRQIPARAIPTVPDATNDPSYCVIGGVILSGNVIVPIKNEKILAESQIIDGVSVFEHISRKPCEIVFAFTIFPNGVIKEKAEKTNAFYGINTFNQQALNTFWNSIWSPNTVQNVQNTYLNGIGIQQIILKSISVAPRD